MSYEIQSYCCLKAVELYEIAVSALKQLANDLNKPSIVDAEQASIRQASVRLQPLTYF